MFVGYKKQVMDTLIDDCTQKKLAKSSNFFIRVYFLEPKPEYAIDIVN